LLVPSVVPVFTLAEGLFSPFLACAIQPRKLATQLCALFALKMPFMQLLFLLLSFFSLSKKSHPLRLLFLQLINLLTRQLLELLQPFVLLFRLFLAVLLLVCVLFLELPTLFLFLLALVTVVVLTRWPFFQRFSTQSVSW